MNMKRRLRSLFLCVVLLAWFAGPTFAMNAKTNIGPALAVLDGKLYLFFKGHNNDHIWHAVLRSRAWKGLGRVNDQNPPHMEQRPDSTVSWAFSSHEPAAFGSHVPRLARKWNYLVFKGHNNNLVWYTIQKWHTTYGGTVYYKWQDPRPFPDAHILSSPSAVEHTWGNASYLTVAFRGTDNRIYFIKGEGGRPVALPKEARTSEGPVIVSYNNHIYIFYKGLEDDTRIHVAHAHRNTPSFMDWRISTLPRAFTREKPAVVNYQGNLVVAYTGHNNHYIWLRRSSDGEHWDRLGYIRNVATEQSPALVASGDSLYLSFRPLGDNEICVGTLQIEGSSKHDSPGHTWSSIRYDNPRLNCSSR